MNFLSAFRQDLSVVAPILPEVELTLFGLAILLFDFMLDVKDKTGNAVLAMMGVIFAGVSLFQLGRQLGPNAVGGFSESIIVDPFFRFFALIFLIATGLVILLSVRYMQIEQEQHGEYYALLMFACVGMMLMASGYDLVVLFLGLETMAISFYILTGFLRGQRRSNEAAVKYLLLGAFSSGLLAYGFSLLYGISAMADLQGPLGLPLEVVRTNLDVVRAAVGLRGPDLLVMLAVVTISAGLFFKVAAVPFHQWAPDAYEGAPTPITAYISVASKTASFALLLRVVLYGLWPIHLSWVGIVAAVAIASLTLGNFAAITQNNIKRLLAYSSISHVGYILLGLVAVLSGAEGNETGLKGIAFYLFVYAFMTIGAFGVVIVLRRQGLIGDEIDDLNGLSERSPFAATLMLIFMLSLAGIPPLAGFVGKYFILQSLIETQHYYLALFGALYIVPGLYYYFRIVAHAWLRPASGDVRPVPTAAQSIALGVVGVITVIAGIYPEPFIRLATYSLSLPAALFGR